MMDDLERSLLDAERPGPGADVRARVLGATMPLVRSDDSRLDRIWFSPKWRVAAVLMLLLFPSIDAVSTRFVASAPATQEGATANTVQAVETAAREAGLTPDDTAALCGQAIAAAGAATMIAPNADTLVRRSNQ